MCRFFRGAPWSWFPPGFPFKPPQGYQLQKGRATHDCEDEDWRARYETALSMLLAVASVTGPLFGKNCIWALPREIHECGSLCFYVLSYLFLFFWFFLGLWTSLSKFYDPPLRPRPVQGGLLAACLPRKVMLVHLNAVHHSSLIPMPRHYNTTLRCDNRTLTWISESLRRWNSAEPCAGAGYSANSAERGRIPLSARNSLQARAFLLFLKATLREKDLSQQPWREISYRSADT